MNQQTQTIGFIGLGLMGSRMAIRLLEAGYPLTVYNRIVRGPNPLPTAGPGSPTRPRSWPERWRW
jgi:3-hydroxyisobutyrate dehydrogenase